MSATDLTNLPSLKAWLGLPSSASPNDAALGGLVTAASRAVYAWLARPSLLPKSWSEVIDSEGTRVPLRHWPVLSVSSVICNGYALPAVPTNVALASAYGFLLKPDDGVPPGRPQVVDIFGFTPTRGPQTYTIGYQAGYAVQNEAQSIPASGPATLTALAPYGAWASDLGVNYSASGRALVAVASAPTLGQYSVASGLYTFASADAGAAVQISYGFVPQDLAQATLELAAERFRAAEHIGLRSKSLGGQETIAFDPSPMSAPVLALLQPYRRVAV